MSLLSLLFILLGVVLILMDINEHAYGDKPRWKKAIEMILAGYAFLGALMIAIGVVLYTGPHS